MHLNNWLAYAVLEQSLMSFFSSIKKSSFLYIYEWKENSRIHWYNCWVINVERQAMPVRPKTPWGDTNACIQTKATLFFYVCLRRMY